MNLFIVKFKRCLNWISIFNQIERKKKSYHLIFKKVKNINIKDMITMKRNKKRRLPGSH